MRMAVLVASLVYGLVFADSPEGDGPEVKHAPVTTAVRGIPFEVAATIAAAEGSTVTSATVLVRLTDAGTPIRTPMAAGENGLHSATLPVSMFRSVSVFWYAVEARDQANRIGGTPWIRVVIADAMTKDGAAKAAESDRWKKAAWIGGGLLVAGGAVAIVAANDDDDDKPAESVPPPATPPPKSGGSSSTDTGGGSPDLSGLTNYICKTTGREAVSYQNLSRCEGTDDILILVCYTCLNADIQADGSWGESASLSDYSNVGCNNSAPRLVLRKPARVFPTPGSESITVRVNGTVVATEVWPPLSDNDCF